MNGLITVLLKECRDNIRDRRTILSSFSLALFGPALFIGLMTFMLNTALGESDEPVSFAVVGADHAPGLVAFLHQQNTSISLLESVDAREEVTSGRHELVLVIRSDYAQRFHDGAINALTLIHDGAKLGSSRRQFAQVRDMINRYARTLGVLRLQVRGIDPAIATPLVVQEVDTASPAARALAVLATLPYLLVLVIFMGGFYLAIDTTAGEREHGSLEPLLSQPISRRSLVLGKLFATTLFSAASLLLFLISLAISIPFVPLHKIGMSLDISATTAAAMFAVSVPLMVFAAALLTVFASFAKSYKEAQTYLTLIILVPTLPLILTQLLDVGASSALMTVPSLSQATLIGQLITGEPVSALHVILSVVSTLAAASLLAWLAIWLYRRERILI